MEGAEEDGNSLGLALCGHTVALATMVCRPCSVDKSLSFAYGRKPAVTEDSGLLMSFN